MFKKIDTGPQGSNIAADKVSQSNYIRDQFYSDATYNSILAPIPVKKTNQKMAGVGEVHMANGSARDSYLPIGDLMRGRHIEIKTNE